METLPSCNVSAMSVVIDVSNCLEGMILPCDNVAEFWKVDEPVFGNFVGEINYLLYMCNIYVI